MAATIPSSKDVKARLGAARTMIVLSALLTGAQLAAGWAGNRQAGPVTGGHIPRAGVLVTTSVTKLDLSALPPSAFGDAEETAAR